MRKFAIFCGVALICVGSWAAVARGRTIQEPVEERIPLSLSIKTHGLGSGTEVSLQVSFGTLPGQIFGGVAQVDASGKLSGSISVVPDLPAGAKAKLLAYTEGYVEDGIYWEHDLVPYRASYVGVTRKGPDGSLGLSGGRVDFVLPPVVGEIQLGTAGEVRFYDQVDPADCIQCLPVMDGAELPQGSYFVRSWREPNALRVELVSGSPTPSLYSGVLVRDSILALGFEARGAVVVDLGGVPISADAVCLLVAGHSGVLVDGVPLGSPLLRRFVYERRSSVGVRAVIEGGQAFLGDIPVGEYVCFLYDAPAGPILAWIDLTVAANSTLEVAF